VEIRLCNRYLRDEIIALPGGAAILALGRLAHDAVLMALDVKRSALRFRHGARHDLPRDFTLFDSYHCSRYNTQTRRLTPEMFRSVFAGIAEHLSCRK
jgi:uracil-DNA glycosylase